MSDFVSPTDHDKMLEGIEYAQLIWYRLDKRGYLEFYDRHSRRRDVPEGEFNTIIDKLKSMGWYVVYTHSAGETMTTYFERPVTAHMGPANAPTPVPAGPPEHPEAVLMLGGERCRITWLKGNFYVKVTYADRRQNLPFTSIEKILDDFYAEGWRVVGVGESGMKQAYELGRAGVIVSSVPVEPGQHEAMDAALRYCKLSIGTDDIAMLIYDTTGEQTTHRSIQHGQETSEGIVQKYITQGWIEVARRDDGQRRLVYLAALKTDDLLNLS